MSYTLAQAATATGLNKSTVLRSIKAGKVSASKDEHGEWQIEPCELHRVYPPAETRTDGSTDARQRYAPPAAPALEAQIEALRAIGDLLRRELDDVRTDRDHWRDQAQSVTRQLADQTTTQRRPWWRRMAG